MSGLPPQITVAERDTFNGISYDAFPDVETYGSGSATRQSSENSDLAGLGTELKMSSIKDSDTHLHVPRTVRLVVVDRIAAL